MEAQQSKVETADIALIFSVLLPAGAFGTLPALGSTHRKKCYEDSDMDSRSPEKS